MAPGADRWVRAGRYHEELYRDGVRQPYTLSAVYFDGGWLFELWELSRLPRNKWDKYDIRVIASGRDAAEVKRQLQTVAS